MHAWPSPEIPRLPGQGLPVQVRDTSSGALVPAVTGADFRMYVCGITPYDATHLGHANTYVTFDLLNRAVRDSGVPVHYVQNVTDVDDPLLERANATGDDWRELAARETELFREDMIALRVLAPEHYVGAVEAIPVINDFLVGLRERGALYEVEPDTYFSVHADPAFGSVANLSQAEMQEFFAERGGDPDRAGKKDPLDALVWRGERPGEPAWESPAGPGRPGWHIECTAIARNLLGNVVDVMGGGRDLAFPHHEMGASHAHVLTGESGFVRSFVHAGLVGYEGEKMSKSRGNLVFVSKLRAAGVEPAAIRLALLSRHYATDWEYTDDVLTQAQERLARWRAAVSRPDGPDATETLAAVRAALAHDLDAPTALAAIDAWAARQEAGGGSDLGAPGVLSRLSDALLGVAL